MEVAVADPLATDGVDAIAHLLGVTVVPRLAPRAAILAAINRHYGCGTDELTAILAGDSVAGPLRATKIFPDMVPSMIEVGEETGALPDMLVRVADGYDEEVDNAVNALTSLIEPLMIVVMAVMVGTIVIALFLPIIRIIQSLG
ncbi:MAG: type II secretion system F family protein [Cephaloticoccus sp.]